MSVNNISDLPTFQTVDTNAIEENNSIYSRTVPVQNYASEPISQPASTSIPVIISVCYYFSFKLNFFVEIKYYVIE